MENANLKSELSNATDLTEETPVELSESPSSNNILPNDESPQILEHTPHQPTEFSVEQNSNETELPLSSEVNLSLETIQPAAEIHIAAKIDETTTEVQDNGQNVEIESMQVEGSGSAPEEEVAEKCISDAPQVETVSEHQTNDSANAVDNDPVKMELVEEEAQDVQSVEIHSQIVEENQRVTESSMVEEEHPDMESEFLKEIDFQGVDYDLLSREKLVEVLKSLVDNDDINGIKTQVGLIKVTFIRKTKERQKQELESYIASGGREDEFQYQPDDIEHQFDAVFDIYKEKKLQFAEELERQKQQNLEAKLAILDELRALINSEETLKKTYDEFRNLQEKWRQIGMVPKSEVNTLWQNYHFLVEKFFDKVKINKELKDLDLKKNLESKIELCEKAEELLLEPNVMKSFKELQKYHEQWREIGPVPSEKRDEIWERFKAATEKINARRREYYDKLQDELRNNYESKQALIEKAREIIETPAETIRQWQENTRAIDELFKIWRSVGPAPRKVNDQIWNQFKELLDQFYKQKSEFFSKIKEQQLHNYNLKLDLCVQAEALRDSTDWKNTTKEMINLQKEWKKVGPVPRKQSEKIWKRFRTACDQFFKAKEEYFSNIHQNEKENLRLKEELIKQVEEYPYTDDKAENLRVIKEFQRKWVEIGYVPLNEKERLQNSFRKAIDKQLDRLNISPIEVDAMSYKLRFEQIKDLPDGHKTIIREINFLQNKAAKMTEDVTLWENNLGFLASSKNADILRQEFERKIHKTKQEIKLIEAKVKFLKEELNKK
ncbi:MAG: DUF349 domain-containing protein [Bacteroidales bacterium]|nr:DUF349 domain-containing protein [Bacteroidales bacterium]MBP9587758.1 DUF349 domain-containing protein [Bacteroidales bacterium]